MKHPFFEKSRKEQKSSQIVLAIYSLVIIMLSVILSIYSGVYLIGILVFTCTLSIVAPFFDMPSLKKSERVTYYSPLFIGEKAVDGSIKIHGGTLFDYYYVIDRKMTGKQRLNFIIRQYIAGLLVLIEEHKDNKHLKVSATSYIINERTASKLGFKIVETNNLQKMMLICNYPNILTANSIANRKLSFPNLAKTKTFETDISALIDRKAYLEKLISLMDRDGANNF